MKYWQFLILLMMAAMPGFMVAALPLIAPH
jgi:hypothetical protein